MSIVMFTYSPSEETMPSYEMPPEMHDRILRICKMLSDSTRLRIAYYLTNESELNVSQLCKRVEQSQPAVSHHLAMMRAVDLVAHRRAGRQIYYSLRDDVLRHTLTLLFASTSETPNQAVES